MSTYATKPLLFRQARPSAATRQNTLASHYAGWLAVLPVSRTDGWIAAFDILRHLENNLFVPGHVEPGKLADFEHSTYQYLTLLKTHMDAAVDQGIDLQDAIRTLDQ